VTSDPSIRAVQTALGRALRQARRRRYIVRAAIVAAALALAAGFLYGVFS